MSNNPRFGIRNVPPAAALSALAAVVAVGVIAVFILLGQHGSPSAPAGTGLVGTGPAGTAGSGSGAPAGAASATLELTGPPDVTGSWTLDGISGDISPTSSIVAAIWTKTIDNVAAGYGDLVSISLGGPVQAGTRATSADGLTLGFGIQRTTGQSDVFDHQWSSRGGECQVTMVIGADISGSFVCASITSADGVTVKASGTFRT
jgi:hypothetical protein